MAIVHDFPSIARIMNRQVQKAEFEAKQPTRFIRTMSGDLVSVDDAMGPPSAGRLTGGGSCETKTLLVADLPRFNLPDLRGRAKVG
jgi:hypothetical protein